MFERFTERARHVIVAAQAEARALNHHYIGTEHLLLGLLGESNALAARVLAACGLSAGATRTALIEISPLGDEAPVGVIKFTPRAKKVCELALREALSLGHNYIGTEHLLLGLSREDEGGAARLLQDFDADSEKVRNEVIRHLSGGRKGVVSEGVRWLEYVTCQKRGHTAEGGARDRKRCTYCGTTYWTETVQRELGAPIEPGARP